ncbi:MAG: hypothetical protein MI892_26530 [Desulfobacterales bacterium]|nr:hypothetical protein [Desulfobacterales bacterium]
MNKQQHYRKSQSLFVICIACMVIGLSINCSADTGSVNGSKPTSPSARIKKVISDILEFRIKDTEELVYSLSSLRNGNTESVQDYVFMLSLYATQESEKILIFTEETLPELIESETKQNIALEFLEYRLDVSVWDLWRKQEYCTPGTDENKMIMNALNTVKTYRKAFPRKKEAELAKDMKTMFPAELDSNIDYTEQAKKILKMI